MIFREFQTGLFLTTAVWNIKVGTVFKQGKKLQEKYTTNFHFLMYHGAVARGTVSIFSLTHPTIAVGSSFPRARLTDRYKTRIHINKIIPVFMWFKSRIQKQLTVAPVGSKVNTELSPVKQLNVTKLNLTWVET